MRTLLLIGLCLAFSVTYAQNLLINGSFEDTAGNVRFNEDPRECIGWDTPYDGSFFTGIYMNPPTGIGPNFEDFDNLPTATDGDAYIGFWGNGYGPNPRRHGYITGLLFDPLTIGGLYKISFKAYNYNEGGKKIRLDFCGNTDALGVKMSKNYNLDDIDAEDLTDDTGEAGVYLEPDYQSGVFGGGAWVDHSFVMQADDDYRLITFGNFQSRNDTFCEDSPPIGASLIFIDDVIVEETNMIITGETLICSQETIELTATVASGFNGEDVVWYDSESTASVGSGAILQVSPQSNVEYTAVLGGIETSHSVQVISLEDNEFVLGYCPNDIVQLSPSVRLAPGVSFEWWDDTTLPFNLVKEPGEYYVDIRFKDCEIRQTFIVDGTEICDCEQATASFPLAFSPNGNGLNDIFKPLVACDVVVENYTMSFFNRWGNKVAEVTNDDDGWDGRTNGGLADAGNYLYVAELTLSENKKLNLSGMVQLIH